MYDFCSPALQQQLDGPRAAYKAHQDLLLEQAKLAKRVNKNGEVRPTLGPAAVTRLGEWCWCWLQGLPAPSSQRG